MLRASGRKFMELQSCLSASTADVVVVQEAQLAAGTPSSIAGYQVAAVARRARGRRDGGPAKGGDLATYVRDGLAFKALDPPSLHPEDDSTEVCAVRGFLVSNPSQPKSTNTEIDISNVYRPPIRAASDDDRVDEFSLAAFPTAPNVIITGDLNAHHSDWEPSCGEPDITGITGHGRTLSRGPWTPNCGSRWRTAGRRGRIISRTAFQKTIHVGRTPKRTLLKLKTRPGKTRSANS